MSLVHSAAPAASGSLKDRSVKTLEHSIELDPGREKSLLGMKSRFVHISGGDTIDEHTEIRLAQHDSATQFENKREFSANAKPVTLLDSKQRSLVQEEEPTAFGKKVAPNSIAFAQTKLLSDEPIVLLGMKSFFMQTLGSNVDADTGAGAGAGTATQALATEFGEEFEGQLVHTAEPAPEYIPEAQLAQTFDPESLANEPAMHGVQFGLNIPVDEN